MLTRLKRHISPAIVYFGKQKEKNRFSSDPVIIGGCARSGTTLLLSILSAHPSLFCHPKELSLFNYWTTNQYGQPQPLRLDRHYRNILFSRIPVSVTRWCEKTPRNIRHIPAILSYFSNRVKIIHIIRDGRDVVLSKHPDHNNYWVSPERWKTDVRKGLAYQNHPNVYTLFYEDLVFDYINTITNLCAFLVEDVTDTLLNWHHHAKIQNSNAWHAPLQEVFKSSVGKWRIPENADRINEFMSDPEAKQLLYHLGYK